MGMGGRVGVEVDGVLVRLRYTESEVGRTRLIGGSHGIERRRRRLV